MRYKFSSWWSLAKYLTVEGQLACFSGESVPHYVYQIATSPHMLLRKEYYMIHMLRDPSYY